MRPPMMTNTYSLVLGCGVLAIVYAFFMVRSVLAAPMGNEAMQKIAQAIQEGAKAYLNRQYKMIAMIGLVIMVAITGLLGLYVGFGFLLGAVASGVAGYVGMNISVRANVRTAEAARQGLQPALDIAFKSGAFTGLLVVALGILSITGYYLVLCSLRLDTRAILEALVALGFGASLISIFARLGGGIFTKGADVGADMVGKIKAGIPEDDPRNPAVIADNVGDNVGDCAGMAADLFETYVVTLVGTMLLAGIYFTGENLKLMMAFPLLIGGVCILASIAGTFFVKLGKSSDIMKALYKGFMVTAVLSAIAIAVICNSWVGLDTVFVGTQMTFRGLNLFYCCLT